MNIRILTNLKASLGEVIWRIMSSFILPILSLALSLRRSSNSFTLNLAMNSCHWIFPSAFVSILLINLSISLLEIPKFNFLIALRNSTYERVPFPSVSIYLKISSKLLEEDLIICLSFSKMSSFHVEFDES
jgi:hypothetical protein